MADFEDTAISQHEDDQCLAATLASVMRHYAVERNLENSPLYGISLKKVGKVIAPAPSIEFDVSVIPHSDNPEQNINDTLLSGTTIRAKERMDTDFSVLEEIIENPMKSLPIVTFHPDYFQWQTMNTDDEAPYRHAIVVLEINENEVKFWDPIETMYQNRVENYKTSISKPEFLDLWQKVIDSPLNTPTPKQAMWLEDEGSEDPGQRRLS